MAVDLQSLKQAVADSARVRCDTATQRMTEDLKRTAPVGIEEGGELQRKTGVEVTSATADQIRAEAVMDTDYAEIVRLGSRPHMITPRRPGGVLRFQVGGRVVFATRVNHPGTQANPFFDDVINRWGQYLESADAG